MIAAIGHIRPWSLKLHRRSNAKPVVVWRTDYREWASVVRCTLRLPKHDWLQKASGNGKHEVEPTRWSRRECARDGATTGNAHGDGFNRNACELLPSLASVNTQNSAGIALCRRLSMHTCHREATHDASSNAASPTAGGLSAASPECSQSQNPASIVPTSSSKWPTTAAHINEKGDKQLRCGTTSKNSPAESPKGHSSPDRSPAVQWRRSRLSSGSLSPETRKKVSIQVLLCPRARYYSRDGGLCANAIMSVHYISIV